MQNDMARDSPEQPSHGRGGHGGALLGGEEDGGFWPTSTARADASGFKGCAMGLQSWLQEQLGEDRAMVEQLVGEAKLDDGTG